MTTYGAYNAGLRCKNQNCHSFGKPHPNCRCYGEYANGGGVGAFCDENRSHQKGCEYFAEGGDTLPEGFTLEDAPAAPEAAAPDASQDDIPEGFQLEDETPTDMPEGFSLEPEEKEGTPKTELNFPHSVEEAGTRLVQDKGLFRGTSLGEEYPAGQDGKWTTPENIAKMDSANETAFGAAALLTGGAGVKAVTEAAKGVAELAELGKFGTSFLKNAIAGGVIQGANEVDNWMLGQGDPEHPVGAALAHTGVAGIITGMLGVGGTAGSKTLQAMAESKLGGRLQAFMAGFASAAQNPTTERGAVDAAMNVLHEQGGHPSLEAYKMGQKAFDGILTKLPKGAAKAVGAFLGNKIGGLPGAMTAQHIAGALYEPLTNMVEKAARPAARKVVAPVTMKILSSGNTQGLMEALGHAEQVASGFDAVTKGVESILGAGKTMGVTKASEAVGDSARKKLDDWIGKGGIQQEIQQEIYNQGGTQPTQGFAEGGEVEAPEPPKSSGPGIQENKGMAMHYPEQNMLMAMARGRISNYLTSLKPQENAPRLAFDDAPDSKEKKKSYHRALDIAIKPLSIMDEIRKGTLEPEHMRHFNSLHPELGGLLKKKITEGIIKAQLAGRKPPYAMRQSLSMFMGTALSAEMQPQNIQAAQRVFAQQGQQPAPQGGGGGKSKGSTKSLTKSDDAFLTSNQARQTRRNKV